MANNLVQVTLTQDTAIPSDACVNAWSFFTATPKDDAIGADILAALEVFYQVWDDFMPAELTGTGVVKFYDRGDATPRVPWLVDTISFTPGAGIPLPTEVAMCLSIAAAPVSGVAAARRRGRLYLGPWTADALGNATGQRGRPKTSLTDLVAAGAGALKDASDASGDWTWHIWSPTDGVGREVNNGWVDNAWDTQRRRGVDPTTRSTFTP